MKTSELEGAALDWVVDNCENKNYGVKDWLEQRPRAKGGRQSTNWSQGGPIIERDSIAICHLANGEWKAHNPYCRQYGPTPLIAAMRCYVASKLGDEVEIPGELR